jgi:X-Pro dipeptidyl-peptidase-like protein
MRASLRLGVLLGAVFTLWSGTGTAQAEIPDTLKSSCTVLTPAPGYSYRFCDDGLPPTAGRTPNPAGTSAVEVPAKYRHFLGLPAKAADAATMPGADPDGNVALDVDISIPTLPAPAAGYPLIAFMHGCCSGTKKSWEDTSFDAGGEKWHYSNAWFAARGYVVLNYTARGFRTGDQGSTGETQLDHRAFEINDFQHLAGQIADDPFFDVNPSNILATGGSYGGGFSWLALTDPFWASPGRKQMELAAVAPKYGWTDLAYSLVPTGKHFQAFDRLPATDGSDSTVPIGIPKRSIIGALRGTGQTGTTFPPYIDEAFACFNSADPFETNPACEATLESTVPSFIRDRSAYYQNTYFKKLAESSAYRVPAFNAATLTDPLFTPVENLRMSNRLQRIDEGYPIKQFFGDYQHFVQNKAKEWGDVCGADHHVCRFDDYPGGNLNATPTGLRRGGVTTQLNRFIDHFARPPGNARQPQPQFDVTAALQICPQNASPPDRPADEPGTRFSAARFQLLAEQTLRINMRGDQTTVNDVEPNQHAKDADPFGNLLRNGGRCPFHTTPAGPGVASYTSEALPEAATMIGGAIASIDYAATTAEGLQLNSRLYDVFPDGTAVMVDRGPRRVEEASGTLRYQLHGNGWRFPPGHKIRIEVAQDDDPFLRTSNVPSSATVSAVRLRIPVREEVSPLTGGP